MSLTDNPSDPNLRKIRSDGQQESYLVLSDEERAKGFVRPLRTTYVHAEELGGCGAITSMGRVIAETYARDPNFYDGTFCARCGAHFPVGENGQFKWDGPYDPQTGIYQTEKVGT